MKKVISIFICAVLVFSLAACTGGKTDTDKATDTSSTNAPVQTTEAPKSKVEISRGTIEGDVYTNEFAEFRFTKPAEWKFLSDEEIASTINIGQDALDLNFLEKALAEKSTIYDMASQDEYGNSVMVCYENTMISALREISVDEYTQIMKTQLAAVEEIEYEFQSSEDIKIGETDFRKLVFSATTQGYTITQAYYVKAIGKYVVTVIVTAVEDVSAIEAMLG